MSSPIDRARQHLLKSRVLPFFLAEEVLECAEQQARRIATLEQQAVDTTAARYEDARLFNVNLAQIAGLQASNKRLRRDLWLLAVLSPIVTLIFRALWSAYAPS